MSRVVIDMRYRGFVNKNPFNGPINDEWSGDMATVMAKECKHGQLARSCELCEKDQQIARLIDVLQATASNIRSLGPAGALDAVPMPYQRWLAVVEAAISEGLLGAAAHTRCDVIANPSGPVSCGNEPAPAL